MNFPEYIPLHGQWWSPFLFILGVLALPSAAVSLVNFFIKLKAKSFKERWKRNGFGALFLVSSALVTILVISLVNFNHAYNANEEAWSDKVVKYVSVSYGLTLDHDDIYKFANGETVTVTDKATGQPLLVQLRDIDSKRPELIGADASTLRRIER